MDLHPEVSGSPCTQTHTKETPSPASPTGLNSPVLQDRETR